MLCSLCVDYVHRSLSIVSTRGYHHDLKFVAKTFWYKGLTTFKICSDLIIGLKKMLCIENNV